MRLGLVPVRQVFDLLVQVSLAGRVDDLAYVRYESTANVQSVAFDPSTGGVTGEPVWVTRGFTGVSNPQLSPDGERYVARWPRLTQEDIAVFDKDGSNWRSLTDDKFQDRRPRWFPDGQRVAFSSDRSGVNQIWSINADGAGLRQLTFAEGYGASWPVLSPDGAGLAYLQLTDEGARAFMIDLNRGGNEQRPEPLPPVPDFKGYFNPNDWSPDGNKLIGTFVDEDKNEAGVGVYSLSSRSYEWLTDRGGYPSWLKDSRKFIFIQKTKIYLADADSKKAQAVFTPSLHGLQNPSISQDNLTLSFRFLQVEADVWLLSLE